VKTEIVERKTIGESRMNPDGPGEKVLRGGSWHDRPFRATSSYRLGDPAWQPVYHAGFQGDLPRREVKTDRLAQLKSRSIKRSRHTWLLPHKQKGRQTDENDPPFSHDCLPGHPSPFPRFNAGSGTST